MAKKWDNQSERIQKELKNFADHNPEILTTALITVDGLTLGLYSKNPSAREAAIMSTFEGKAREVEDRFGPISAAITSLSERISSELGAGEWDFSVIAGKKAKIFQRLVDDETVIIAITQPESSPDAMWPELKATCERLIQS
jgi:predicted regulator of Ras-like GTPase activity (Roadblock/LC7/MglB family)